MIEGEQVVAGEAILSGRTSDRESSEHGADSIDDAVESLVRDHSQMVYRIAYAVLRSHHDAEDVTQETFMRVLRYRSKLESVENPKTWLARIAWRVSLDRRRKHPPAQEVPLNDPAKAAIELPSSEAAIDDAFHGFQVSSILEKLIAALPAKLRDPLVLSTIEEMTTREVAATLGIREAAVRSRIFRARQMLKERLARQKSGERVTS